jgi:hypothetical protein
MRKKSKAENQFSLKILTAILIAGFLASCSLASIFKDQKNNLYLINKGELKKSSDLGETWTSLKLPTTAEARLLEDEKGRLILTWAESQTIKIAYSRDGGYSFSKPYANIRLEKIPEYFKLLPHRDRLHLIYLVSGYIYYQYSLDQGQTFSPVKILNENLPAKLRPEVSDKDGALLVSFSSKNKIYLMKSSDYGQNFNLPSEIYSTTNPLTGLLQISDQLFFVEKQFEDKYLLKHCPLDSPQNPDQILIHTQEPLSLEATLNEQQNLILSFKPNLKDPPQFFIFDPSRPLALKKITEAPPQASTYAGLIAVQDSLYSIWSNSSEIKVQSVPNQKPSAPTLDGLKSNQNTSKIRLKQTSSDPDADPLTYKVLISWDENFASSKTWTFDRLSPEAEIISPLPDGKYYLRVYASDGLAYSPPSKTSSFFIDREAPKLTLTALPPITNQDTAEVKGILSENAALTVNQETINLSNLSFNKILKLQPGDNQILVCATDEAGNSTSESLSIIFDPNAPLLTAIKPQANEWFKNGGTVYIEIAVSDQQDDMEDESEAEMLFDGKPLPLTLLFDRSVQKLFGFIPLPSDLSHGPHILKVNLKDISSNLGTLDLTINIDNLPPLVKEKSLAVSKDRILIPCQEEGGGLDAATSLISVRLSSVEVAGKVLKQGENLVFIPQQQLKDGNYEIAITPRDAVGNVGDKKIIFYAFDSSESFIAGNVSASDVKFIKFKYGPNPFTPGKDPKIMIDYELTRIADIKLYIFSLLGELVFSRNLGSVTSNAYGWAGKNYAGEVVAAGLYPFVLSADDHSGKKEIMRGKIIILK